MTAREVKRQQKRRGFFSSSERLMENKKGRSRTGEQSKRAKDPQISTLRLTAGRVLGKKKVRHWKGKEQVCNGKGNGEKISH